MRLLDVATLLSATALVACGGAETRPLPPPAPVVEAGTPAEDPVPAPVVESDDRPPPTEAGATACEGPPPGPGYECVRSCGPPVAREGDPPPGWSWLSAEQAERRRQFGCPRCLPADAPMATPEGPVAISALEPGARVWAVDGAGRRVVTRVVEAVSAPAPPDHELVQLELADGRTVRASPGHPDADGRALGSVSVGDALDGSVVTRVGRVPYAGRTWDLVLADGRTLYVVGGITLQTTLAP